jgi:phenylalanyl-tRNA synthetase alpha chain
MEKEIGENEEDLLQRIDNISKVCIEAIQKEITLDSLENSYKRFTGKKGELSAILHSIANLEPESRRRVGSAANIIKAKIEELYNSKKENFKNQIQSDILLKNKIDLTIPGVSYNNLHKHPITAVLEETVNFFMSMGFEVAEGPEIETTYYNFDALNIPANHPARDVWDTFYLKNGLVPRTHTSSVQVRTMESKKPPIRIIAPGKCYRYESVDATHLFMFNQVEGLFVDKTVRLSDLKGILEATVRHLLGAKKTRFRPAFYPFVEPGLDLDIECVFCGGKGCNICKFTGWIEVIPCGMVHPKVFEYAKYDPNEYKGFAFGMGFDRMVMLKYNINDLRLLYQGNIDILSQF